MLSLRAAVRFIILISITVFTLPAAAQNIDTVEARVSQLLAAHYKKYPQEKLFIHTDEDLYANGQTIWYKVYAMAYGKPSGISGIVYVQLADSAGNVLTTNKLQLLKGTAHGNIDIPGIVHSGWYQLTGFTAWMMNFDRNAYFQQKIYIQNTSQAITPSVNSPKKYHISFFPEGGDLVEGSLCNIAFKATDTNGMPVKAEGAVIDNDKKAIAKIVTIHDGMGLFSIEGHPGKINTAVVHFPDQSVQTLKLPEFKKEGLVLQVNALPPDAIELKIKFEGDVKQYGNVLLAAYQVNGVSDTYPIRLKNGINVFSIKKSGFSTGILRFTLFGQNGTPQAERIVFINKNDQLKLSLNTDSLSFQPRGKSVIRFNSQKADGKPAQGNFSVSILDADADDDHMEDNIFSSLLMSSELKGKIYHPAWYFKNNSDTLLRQLDLVMLTNGWRHFKWDKDTLNIKYPVERSQFIAGKIMDYDPQLYAKSGLQIKLIIQNQDSSKYIGYVTPDKTGQFILKNYDHSGASDIFMEATDAKNHVKKLKIKLLNTLEDSLKNFCCQPADSVYDISMKPPGHLLANASNEQLQSDGVMLKTINISAKKLSPTEEIIKNHVGVLYESDKAYTLDLVNNPTLNIGIIQYITGRFPGLRITGTDNDAVFVYLSSNTLITPGGKYADSNNPFHPYVFINEVHVDFSNIFNISLVDIALIRYVPPPVMFAPFNGGNVGALLIYTKNNKDENNRINTVQFDKYTFNGYSITREFSSPDYANSKIATMADTRSTLFWNHDLDTDASGTAKIHFYNSDSAKHYRIVIQGMDASGRVGYLSEIF